MLGHAGLPPGVGGMVAARPGLPYTPSPARPGGGHAGLAPVISTRGEGWRIGRVRPAPST